MERQANLRRILVIWVVASAVAIPLIVLVLGPHLPPGDLTAQASDQTSANIVLTAVCAPVVLLIAIYFSYALVSFRQRGDKIEDGAPIRGHGPLQLVWLGVTSVTVIALAIWGSLVLVVNGHGAGGGQGPNPVALPPNSNTALQVQVIGQQWNWTYRFPGYGAVETDQLEIPANRLIAFHVTSLDVVHSFWAYELGVKADAVPGTDNVAFVQTHGTGSFSIRCAELCGLWHGHMYQTGKVVAGPEFSAWIAEQIKKGALNHKYLPPYAKQYFPEPQLRAG